MNTDLEYPEIWDVSLEEEGKSAEKVHPKSEGIKDLFNRAAFDGERIIMRSGDASFAIVPIEDVILLDVEDL